MVHISMNDFDNRSTDQVKRDKRDDLIKEAKRATGVDYTKCYSDADYREADRKIGEYLNR